uniref:Acetyltransferase-like isoleucine patch superfamily enzyme n=1 Tax=Rhodocyclus tenuis TaxID=1066 RepID=A0A840GDJ2_RHOTE|nr:acetyltransferase-like isoleucine patch superfamily enzyme [Rhodocyclus tenuis]
MQSKLASLGFWRFIWRCCQVLLERWRFIWWGVVANLFLRVHPAVTCSGWVTVTGPVVWRLDPRGRLSIGKNVRLHSGHAINSVGGHRRLILALGPAGVLILEDGCGISSSTIVCRERIRIGAGAMIGGGCQILDSDFHSILANERALPGNPGALTAPVDIGERAFVGTGVMILKGGRVGLESIVGAGSVVTGTVGDGEVWAGNPARRIREKTA